jgi:hypothetical protein
MMGGPVPWVVGPFESTVGPSAGSSLSDLVIPTPIAVSTITAIPTGFPEGVDWMSFLHSYVPPDYGLLSVPSDLGSGRGVLWKVSYFWPPYAYEDPKYDINCGKDKDGKLACKYLASGDLFVNDIGWAAACPVEFAFGTIIKVGPTFYECRERGGAIVKIDEGVYWVDILYPYQPDGYYWGQIVEGSVYER